MSETTVIDSSKISSETVDQSLRFRGAKQKEGAEESWSSEPTTQWADERRKTMMRLPSGLEYNVLRMAQSADAPSPGLSTPCRCHFRGFLAKDGKQFNSTYPTGSILVRPEEAVKGWSEAMQMMRVGDKWELYLPSELACNEKGERGLDLPADSALLIELQLTEVNVPAPKGRDFGVTLRIFLLTVVGLLLTAYHHVDRWDAVKDREVSKVLANRGPTVPVAMVSGLKANPHVFFDIQADGQPLGRIEFELFATLVPKTVENFRSLTTGEQGDSTKSGLRLHYKGSKFFRIVPGFMCQGGDFEKGTGAGGESIYGGKFKDEWEHGVIQHTVPGLLTMASRAEDAKDDNGSQFFLTFAPAPFLDNRHVVFGRVVHGMDVLKHIEVLGSKNGRPTKSVVIGECGQL